MFKKAIVWTDIHFGKKANSDIHNKDCMDFIDWIIELGTKQNCDTTICCGDFFDVRNSINIKTLNYALESLQKLSKAFKKVVMVLGNHDLYHRGRLDIHSLCFAKHITNIDVVDNVKIDNGVMFLPWIVGDSWKTLDFSNVKYVFSHLELPNFFMNSMNTMPDHGGINADCFIGPKYVFSGHFHKRQVYKNKSGAEIIYIGNCFPHNYSDVNDSDRGCMILEQDHKPTFINWNDCPTYGQSLLSDLLEEPEKLLKNKSNLRVQTDIDLQHHEISFIKEQLIKTFNCRELIFLPKKHDELDEEYANTQEFKTVDGIVLNHIDALDSKTFDKEILRQIYLG